MSGLSGLFAKFPGADLPAGERSVARWNMAVAFIILFGTIGIPAMLIPVLLGPLQDDMGWTRADVASVNTVKFAVGALTAFFTGHMVERWGVRRVGAVCTAMAGAALFLLASVQNLPTYYLVGLLLGVSALGTATSMKIFVSQWFERGQGVAVGIALMGLSIAGVVVPVLANWMIHALGWRQACAVLGGVIWLVIFPLFLWRAREHPSIARREALVARREGTATPLPKGIYRSPIFITLLLSNFLIGMVDEAMSTHLVVFLDREVQLGATIAALGFTLVMVMSNVGKIAFGWLIERRTTTGAAICWVIAGIGILLALPIQGFIGFILFAIVYGPTQGGFLVNVPVLSKKLFGQQAMLRSIAFVTTAFNLGAAVGPALVGWLFDRTGSYHLAFIFLAATAFVSAVLMLACGRLAKAPPAVALAG